MRSFLILALLTSLGLLGSSCQPAKLTPAQLSTYVADPEHGLQQRQQVGQTEVTVTYQPTELLVAREIQDVGRDPHLVDSLRHQYSKAAYFLLSISRDGRDVLQPATGFAHYSELLQTLAFHMDDQVRLVTSQGDTLRPTNYYLDRTATGSNASYLLLAFAKPASSGTWHLHLRECGLGTGDLSFVFDAQQLRAVPTLLLP
jgi:hypothetical protein